MGMVQNGLPGGAAAAIDAAIPLPPGVPGPVGTGMDMASADWDDC